MVHVLRCSALFIGPGPCILFFDFLFLQDSAQYLISCEFTSFESGIVLRQKTHHIPLGIIAGNLITLVPILTEGYRGVFRTQSNISDVAFLRKQLTAEHYALNTCFKVGLSPSKNNFFYSMIVFQK